jgi:uncharacterized membrane protein YebE (DUF533 family)
MPLSIRGGAVICGAINATANRSKWRAQIGEYASEIGGAVLGLEARSSKIAQNPPRHHRKSGAGQQHRSSEPSDDRSTGS